MHKPTSEGKIEPLSWSSRPVEPPRDLSTSLLCRRCLFDPISPPLKQRYERAASGELREGTRFGHPRSPAQKQLHRECMARLRQKLRSSIMSLRQRKRELEGILRHTLATHPVDYRKADQPSSTDKLRHAYESLVREQLKLQDEQRRLRATHSTREKYERLVAREMEKTRIFEVHPPLPEQR